MASSTYDSGLNVERTPIHQDDDTFIGGNGLVPNPDQDRRLWEYISLVNDSLTVGSEDGLSYKRVYMTVFKQNSHRRILCGLLMMTQAVSTQSSSSVAVTGLRGRKSRISVAKRCWRTCTARFTQYLDNTTKRRFFSRPKTLLRISSCPT